MEGELRQQWRRQDYAGANEASIGSCGDKEIRSKLPGSSPAKENQNSTKIKEARKRSIA